MKYLKPFQNESFTFNIDYFDVELREIKEWLYDFLDEHEDLDVDVHQVYSSKNNRSLQFFPEIDKNKFNILITIKGNSNPETSNDDVMITEQEYPIEPYLPFLEDRLKERGLEIVSYVYGKMWPCIRITVSKI